MKAKYIQQGEKYLAKVSGRIVTVRVDNITENFEGKARYNVTNLSTGRRTQFRSAQRFRCVARPNLVKKDESGTT
jgi:hypothetical protein